MSERRLAQRVAVRLTATYRSANGATHGVVTDLSRHGLQFSGPMLDEIGAEATVEVHLADRHLVLRGQVTRRCSEGLGFRFDDLEDHARRQIANIVLSAHSAR